MASVETGRTASSQQSWPSVMQNMTTRQQPEPRSKPPVPAKRLTTLQFQKQQCKQPASPAKRSMTLQLQKPQCLPTGIQVLARPVASPLIDDWDQIDVDDWLVDEQSKPSGCEGTLSATVEDAQQLDEAQESCIAIHEIMASSEGDEKIIGEFLGRIKPPEGGHRRSGKIL